MAITKTHVKYLTDEKGEKVEVVIPLRDYQEMIEDLGDLKVIEQRRREQRIPFEKVKEKLEKKWKLTKENLPDLLIKSWERSIEIMVN